MDRKLEPSNHLQVSMIANEISILCRDASQSEGTNHPVPLGHAKSHPTNLSITFNKRGVRCKFEGSVPSFDDGNGMQTWDVPEEYGTYPYDDIEGFYSLFYEMPILGAEKYKNPRFATTRYMAPSMLPKPGMKEDHLETLCTIVHQMAKPDDCGKCKECQEDPELTCKYEYAIKDDKKGSFTLLYHSMDRVYELTFAFRKHDVMNLHAIVFHIYLSAEQFHFLRGYLMGMTGYIPKSYHYNDEVK